MRPFNHINAKTLEEAVAVLRKGPGPDAVRGL